jgi:hypothetical protein
LIQALEFLKTPPTILTIANNLGVFCMAIKKSVQIGLSDEAKRIEEDATYSSKSHFNAAAIWTERNYQIGVPATITSIIAGAAIFQDCPTTAGLFSLASAVLTGLLTYLKPCEKSSQHKAFGDQYLSLRNDTRLFRTVELIADHKESFLTDSIKQLASRRNELNESSPEIPKDAFEKAKEGIEEGQANYEVDKH